MASLLSKIFGGFKSKKSVLGVDISSSSIKIVQVRYEHGSAILETYGELALGPYTGVERGQATNLPVEKMTGALKDLLKEANVTTKDCGVAIPMSSSLINVIDMPDVDMKKLKAMVPIEMRKYIPVPINEVVMDWRPVPKEFSVSTPGSSEAENVVDESDKENKKPMGRKEIFVVAIHRETIDNYSKIIQSAGLNNSFFEVEIFSTIRTISMKPGEAVMVVDFGAATTKVYIVESGIVRDSHVINRGSQNITLSISKAMGVSLEQAERLKRENGLLQEHNDTYQIASLIVSGIFSEANTVLLNYQKKYHKNISKIVITGGGSVIKGLSEAANKELSVDANTNNPFSTLQYPAFLTNTLKATGPEFAVAIGVALRKLEDIS